MNKLTLFLKLLFSKSLKHKNKLTRNVDNWKSVYDTDIKTANLKPNQLKVIGQSLYLKKLEQVISDLDITEQEKSQLDEIVATFSLDDKYIKSAKQSLNESAVKKLVQKQYEDKVLTDEEKSFIVDFATYLALDNATLEKIRANIASSLFKAAMNEKLKDKRLSPREETELTQTLKDLQIDDATAKSMMPKNSLQDLAFAKLLWQLDNGVFTLIENAPINLKKYEECYLSFSGKLLEHKVVTKGYSTGSQGMSFRVAKGVSYRVGAARSVPIKEQVTLKHSGVLYLTSERVIFASTGKNSFTIKFDKLLTFQVFSDGIGFVIEGWTYLVELSSQQIEMFATGLTSSLRNYLDEENDTRQKAQKEIDGNETFVNISHGK
jgi:transcriptional regulator CtsR